MLVSATTPTDDTENCVCKESILVLKKIMLLHSHCYSRAPAQKKRVCACARVCFIVVVVVFVLLIFFLYRNATRPNPDLTCLKPISTLLLFEVGEWFFSFNYQRLTCENAPLSRAVAAAAATCLDDSRHPDSC